MAQKLCDNCSRTGLLSVGIVKDKDTNKRYVEVVVCEDHTNPNLALKSVEAIIAGCNLPVVIV